MQTHPRMQNHRVRRECRGGGGYLSLRVRTEAGAGAGGPIYLGDDEDDEKARQRRPALFMTPKHRLALDEVLAHSKEAERLYAGRSARIEYCKTKGIDYENVLEYAHILEKLMDSLDDTRKHLLVTCDENGKVKIIIGNGKRSVKSSIGCPLCLDARHRLALCPNLPDELRPFVN